MTFVRNLKVGTRFTFQSRLMTLVSLGDPNVSTSWYVAIDTHGARWNFSPHTLVKIT